MSNKIPNDFHGSDIDAVAQYFHIAPEAMISFAANVNPLGLSPLMKETLSNHLDILSSYPERDYHTLRNSIAAYVHTDANHILVGNGSTELISGVIKSICPKDAVLLSPSYSEYERDIHLCGGNLRYFPYRKELDWRLDVDELCDFCKPETDLLIICNPNNPTGNALPVTMLRDILTYCQNHNITVMIDETYIEFSLQQELFEAIPLTDEFSNLVVLRGVSKFFASPGLRLGYAVSANQKLRDKINHSKDPWTINSLAAKAGEIMFSDSNYQQETKQLIYKEKETMTKALISTGKIHAFPSEANFVLYEIRHNTLTSTDCFAACAKQGMMIRDCSTFPYLGDKYIRICMMLPEDNQRLCSTLTDLLQNS